MNSKNNFNNIHGLKIPDKGGNSPVVLVITSSPIVNSTITAYLLDFGYRVGGPYDSVDGSLTLIRRFTPDLIIFDTVNNFKEISFFKEIVEKELLDIPIMALGNEEINLNISGTLNLPINHQKLGNLVRDILPTIQTTPLEHLIKFVNRFFATIIEIGPLNQRSVLEQCVNKSIYEFCNRNSDFSKQSVESTTIVVTSSNSINSKAVIEQLKYFIDEMVVDIDIRSGSSWGKSLVKDSLETLLAKITISSPLIFDFADAIGVNTREFQKSIRKMIPKLNEEEKAVFVALFSQDDLGPEIILHVTNDDKISKGLDHDLAAQVLTVVGQGTSYHEGIYGPIPIPTANNICALLWSRMLESTMKDERMKGQSLTVVAIGFYTNLITHLPSSDQIKPIFGELNQMNHVNDISDMHLELIKDRFLSSLI